ncbi:MAG: hypothetical protein JST04_02710 [Bdellovibrionales bacterium]|nr:hypothetical protein [Bdellovibrionales bacterium]
METLTPPTRTREVVEKIRDGFAHAYAGWCRFFFEADAVEPMRLFRFSLGILLFVAYVIRAIDNDFYFGANGVLDVGKMVENFPMKYRWSLLLWWPGKAMLWGSTVVFLVSLLTMALGFFPRVSALVAYLLHVSFMHRNMGIVYGLDMIATFFLFYLCFAKTSAAPSRKEDWSTLLTSVALRLCQIQVCVIYAFSGWEKLKGVAWWKGEAIWTVIANAQIARWQMNWMSNFPLVITLLTYMTLLWEIYFPALIWIRKLRPWILIGGLGLHLGIGITVFIPYFSALMIISYIGFLTPDEARWILRRVKSLIPFARL